jgi:hypothetical protein
MKNDENDQNRALVYGIAWCNGFMAISMIRFRETLDASASIINRHLKDLGYQQDFNKEKLQTLKNYLGQSVVRNWSIRTTPQSAQLPPFRFILPVPLPRTAPQNPPIHDHPIDGIPPNHGQARRICPQIFFGPPDLTFTFVQRVSDDESHADHQNASNGY